MVWTQVYDPLGNPWLSTLCAAIPVVVLLGSLAFFRIAAHWAAILGLISALFIAIFVYGMPTATAGGAALNGALFGLLPIGWIVLNIIFLYQLTKHKGYFQILQDSIANVTEDRRLQLLLIAFAFGAFFEGAAGFGTPVAVTGAILIGLGFSPLAASGLSLIANTAPVAYGALGTPVITLAAVTGLDVNALSAMVGRQLPFFSLLVPFWLIWAFAGWRGMVAIWPAILVTGVSFAIPQFLISNYHGPMLVDVGSALISMACLVAFLKFWKPKTDLDHHRAQGSRQGQRHCRRRTDQVRAASHRSCHARLDPLAHPERVRVRLGLPAGTKNFLNGKTTKTITVDGQSQAEGQLRRDSASEIPITSLHERVEKVPPVVAKPTKEKAVYNLNWLSATGSGILLAAIVAGLFMGYSIGGLFRQYWETIKLVQILAAHHRRDAGAGIRDALLRNGCNDGPRVRPHRRAVSLLRDDARLAGRRADRLRHGVQRAVRRPAEDHRRAARPEPDPDGFSQQLRRRDGQDDRRSEHRGGQHRDALVWPRGRHPALRVLPQHRARGAGGLLVTLQAYVPPFTQIADR